MLNRFISTNIFVFVLIIIVIGCKIKTSDTIYATELSKIRQCEELGGIPIIDYTSTGEIRKLQGCEFPCK